MVTAAMKLKDTCSLEEKICQPRHHFKKQRHCFADKGLYSQSYVFSSSHVWMGELYPKEGWTLKLWCFWTMVLEKTLESPLDSKEIKPVNPKWNEPWIITGKTDAEAETPILIWKDPDARRRRMGQQRMRWLDGLIDSTYMSLSKLWETVEDGGIWHAAVNAVAKSDMT